MLGLVAGLIALLYGAQGVTQAAGAAMSQVWNVPRFARPGFLPRLGRSVVGLAVIGGSFLLNAGVSGFATGSGVGYALRVPVIASSGTTAPPTAIVAPLCLLAT